MFDYKPYKGNSYELFCQILDTITYLDDEEKKILTEAYEFAMLAHQ
jgi:hypothetical protein